MDAGRIRLKVCGIASVDEALTADRFGADAIGLVAAASAGADGPDPIPDALIAEIARAVPPSVATFLVTAETEPERIIAHARRAGTSAVQLVRWLEPVAHQQLRRSLLGIRLVQVLRVQDPSVLDQAAQAAETVDALLLHADTPDGMARADAWRLSRQVVEATPVPVFLAGGLNADNVGEAIARVRPFGVDVCRGVRTLDDLNAGKLRAFVSAVNAAPRL